MFYIKFEIFETFPLSSCCGAFMSAEDTKFSRTDSPDHEYVALCPMTNYDGYVYWGEYPLSFAACLSQEECLGVRITPKYE